ncbi:hypothetical protein ACJIZ3_005702 [Penstemon smallii]|uniref:HTH three-helical bundle domain-containing protein n=1 Tax=Penstemon smallii TaxID=265156 RepID=A0ABD3S5Q4_9LAMI
MVSKTMKASFPSTLERTVASALLLLSSSPPVTKVICSTPESNGSVDGESSGSPPMLRLVAYVSGFNDMKFKVVRKKRSKSIWISDDKKLNIIEPKPTCAPASSDCVSEITTADTSSCLSSASSTYSSINKTNAAHKQKKSIISSQLRHQAEAILRVLSNGSYSELRIRQLLGDSPTTSKALRILLQQEEVKRSGHGGRSDPYIYMRA